MIIFFFLHNRFWRYFSFPAERNPFWFQSVSTNPLRLNNKLYSTLIFTTVCWISSPSLKMFELCLHYGNAWQWTMLGDLLLKGTTWWPTPLFTVCLVTSHLIVYRVTWTNTTASVISVAERTTTWFKDKVADTQLECLRGGIVSGIELTVLRRRTHDSCVHSEHCTSQLLPIIAIAYILL